MANPFHFSQRSTVACFLSSNGQSSFLAALAVPPLPDLCSSSERPGLKCHLPITPASLAPIHSYSLGSPFISLFALIATSKYLVTWFISISSLESGLLQGQKWLCFNHSTDLPWGHSFVQPMFIFLLVVFIFSSY